MLKKIRIIFHILILTVILMLTCAVSAFAVIPYSILEDVEETAVPYGLLEKINILTQDEYKTLEADITKGTFLKWIIRMTGIPEAHISSASKQIFMDVPVDSEYAAYAQYGYEKGIVLGNDIGMLDVDDVPSINDAAVMAARAAGYNLNEELLQRAKTEVLEGIESGSRLTCKTAMKIIWNALELDSVVIENDGYSFNNNQNLLNEIFDVYELCGVVDDDAVININNGSSALTEGHISINGVTYETKDNIGKGFAGYGVKAYILQNSDTEEVLFLNPYRNEVQVIDIASIESYTSNAIKIDDRQRTTVDVSSTVKNIQNFKRVYMTAGKLELPEYGSLVAIDNDNSGDADCVFIYVPEYGLVKRYEANNNRLYVTQEISKIYELDNYKNIDVNDYSGEDVALSDVSADSLIEIYASEDKAQFIAFVQKDVIEHTVSSINFNSDEPFVTTAEGAEIILSPCFNALTRITLRPGSVYQLTFDSNGRIAFAQSADGDGLTYGYLFKYFKEDGEERVSFVLYDLNDEMITAKVRDKVRIKQQDGRESSLNSKQLFESLSNDFNPCLIRYEMNEEGLISRIEYSSSDKFSDGFRCVGTSGAAVSGNMKYDARMRTGTINMLGGQILLDLAKTKCIIVPDELSKSADWQIMSVGDALINGKYYQSVKGYAYAPDSMVADVVVLPYSSLGLVDAPDLDPALISGFETAYDEDEGEIHTVIKAWQEGSEISLELKGDLKPQYTVAETGEVIDLEEGDVIRVVKNQKDKVISIKLLFDRSEGTCYGIEDEATDHTNYGYGYQQRTNYGTPYKIVDNAMYIIKEGESDVSSDIFRTDVGYIYEFDESARNPVRLISGDDIETISEHPETTNKIFIQLNYAESIITILYK